MSNYRLYCLDGAGKINFAENLTADSDEQAIAEARRRKHSMRKCEVWQGSRLVATLTSEDLAD